MQSKFYLLFSHGEREPHEMYALMDRVMQEIHRKLRQYLKLTITSMVGQGCVTRDGLTQSIQELARNENQRFYYPHGSIQRLNVIPFEEPIVFHDFVEIVDKLKSSILKGDREEVVSLISSQLKHMRQLRCNPLIVKDWAVKLVLDIKLSLQALSYFSDVIFTGKTEQLVTLVHSMEHMEEVLLDICDQFM